MDQQENAEFVNVGMEQPAEVDRRDDVRIKVDGPSGGKGWKIATICAIVVIAGLCAALVFMFMSMTDANKKADDAQAKLNTSTTELNKFREVTGVENAADYVASDVDMDFTTISSLFGDGMVYALSGSYVKDNGDYQIAKFAAAPVVDGELSTGYTAYAYRTLPDGEWKKSGYTGNGQANCTDLEAADIAAFDGVLECAE